jgi:hypothetical protein
MKSAARTHPTTRGRQTLRTESTIEQNIDSYMSTDGGQVLSIVPGVVQACC